MRALLVVALAVFLHAFAWASTTAETAPIELPTEMCRDYFFVPITLAPKEGYPEDRTDRRVMGNGRLIPLFPARGGPVLHDGVIYFAAGIWPFEGVFVYCLDARSGTVIWRNDNCGARYSTQPHPGAESADEILQQGLEHREVFPAYGMGQRVQALKVDPVRVGLVFEQQLHDIGVSVARRGQQGGLLVPGYQVDVGALVQQQPHAVHVAARTGEHQRVIAGRFGNHVDIGAMLDELEAEPEDLVNIMDARFFFSDLRGGTVVIREAPADMGLTDDAPDFQYFVGITRNLGRISGYALRGG